VKDSEPSYDHACVERVMNSFIGILLKGLGYSEASVTFDVAPTLDKGFETWEDMIPMQPKHAKALPMQPTAPSAHGFYIQQSTEEKHKSEPFGVFRRVEGVKKDGFQTRYRRLKDAQKFIDRKEEMLCKQEESAKSNNAAKPKAAQPEKGKGTSAGAD
jgi:hypothetical protein